MSLNFKERKQIRMIKEFTGCGTVVAQKLLEKAEWNVESAVNRFYNEETSVKISRGQKKRKIDVQEPLRVLFESVQDSENPGTIDDNIEQFCKKIGMKLDSFEFLYFSYLLNCRNLFEIQEKEFISGMEALNLSNLDQLMIKVSEKLKEMAKNGEERKSVYNWSYGATCEEGQKSLPLDAALQLWGLLFADDRFVSPISGKLSLPKAWIDFMKSFSRAAISLDTWRLLYNFLQSYKDDLTHYDLKDPWPVVVDEFVESLLKTN